MSNFDLKIWDDTSDKVTFYTVQIDGIDISETDIFFDKYGDHAKYGDACKDLTVLLFDSIGDKYGAIDDLFRDEDNVEAIPPKGNVVIEKIEFYFPQFPLRLFCMRLPGIENIVILFNGGLKTGNSNLESEHLFKFREAKIFGAKIMEAFRDGTIIFNEESRKITLFNGSEDIYL